MSATVKLRTGLWAVYGLDGDEGGGHWLSEPVAERTVAQMSLPSVRAKGWKKCRVRPVEVWIDVVRNGTDLRTSCYAARPSDRKNEPLRTIAHD